MKTSQLLVITAFALGSFLEVLNTARAEAPVVPSTTRQSSGTVSAFGANAIAVRTEDADRTVRYSSSSTTTFMDENGAPIPMVMLKAGVPVTVDYVRAGDRFIARRVIVLRSLTAGPAIVSRKAPIITAAVETN